MAITHSTPADNTFTPQGKIAWDAVHTGDVAGVNLLDYMPAATRTLYLDNVSFPDVASAFSQAITALTAGSAEGGTLFVPPGSGAIASQVTIADNAWINIEGAGFSSVLKKTFNGDMFSLGAGSRMRGIRLQGNGGSFTGRGVVISSGTQSIGSAREILDCWILDTESYGVEFTAAVSGYASIISNTRIIPTTASVAAVKYPNDAGGGGNRTLSNVWTGSNPLVDFGSADNSTCVGCQGGTPIFSSTSLKTSIVGGRLVNSTGWTIDGTQTTVVGVAISPTAITFSSSLVRCRFMGNAITAGTTYTDNAPGVTQQNEIDIDYTTYEPTWTASVNPSIGDGSLTGAYRRKGAYAEVNINVSMGSTTTFGTGGWKFALPYAATRVTPGSGFFLDSGTALYGASSLVDPSVGAVARAVAAGSAADFVGSGIPFTWASGDLLQIKLVYPIN